MVAYYAMTKFHLIFSMTHRLLENAGEKSVLFVYSGLSDVKEYIEKIEERGLFDEIFILDEIKMRQNWTGCAGIDDSEKIKKNLDILCSEVDEWLPYRLSDFTELYIANDHWSLGLYCIWKGIPYNYYEDGVGMLSKSDYSYELVYKLHKTQAFVAKYAGAFGNNEYVKCKYADLKNQDEGFYDEKAVHYSIKEKLSQLEKQQIQDVLYVFNAPEIHVEESGKVALVFTEHFVNMNRLNIDQQEELYALLCDYFAEGARILIKPHPNDVHINYEKVINGSRVLSRKFPSELIPYCVSGHINLGLAACSTAVLGLKEYFDRIVRFNINIEETYVKFHQYYVLGQLMSKLKQCRFDFLGTEMDQIEHFSGAEDRHRSDGIEITIIDKVDEKNYSTLEVCPDNFILLYSDENSFYFKDIMDKLDKDNIQIIEIRKKFMENSYCLDRKKEYLFMCFADKEIRESVKEVNMTKRLINTGMEIDIDNISDNDRIKVKFLEAYLKSTNEKLDYYIKREKELLEEIRRSKVQ